MKVMFSSLFAMITKWFRAADRFADAGLAAADYVAESMEHTRDLERINRAKEVKAAAKE